ncbi:MAG TPA: hypothetical protein VIL72_10290 [Beijerinckiaceae bacterium]|jgi:hypothetical protein
MHPNAVEHARPWTLLAGAAALLCLGYTLFIAFGAQAGFPDRLDFGARLPFISDKPVGEDGYYLMLAAWSLAEGKGMTANVETPVTGVQPLMTLLLAAIAKPMQWMGFDKFAFARAVVILGGLLLVGFAAVAGRLARRLSPDAPARAAALAFLVTATSFYLWRTFTYGLETGLYLIFFALVVERAFAFLDKERRGVADCVALGALIGLGGLARIDFGIVVALAFLALLALRLVRFSEAVVMALVAGVVVAPWFAWVKWVSGSWAPSSGPAQAGTIDWGSAPGRLEAMASGVAQNLAPWLSPSPSWMATGAVAHAALVGGALLLRRAGPRARRVTLIWAAAAASLPIVYVLFFWAAHFYARYTAPLALFGVLAAALCLAAVARRPALAALAALVLVALNATAAVLDLHNGKVGDGHAVTAGYVHAKLPADAKVGAFQSGVTGFYNANVVNLDGKVNLDALQAMRDKQVEAYVDRAGIDYVIDWEGVIRGLMPGAMESGRWVRCADPVGNAETICVRRATPR